MVCPQLYWMQDLISVPLCHGELRTRITEAHYVSPKCHHPEYIGSQPARPNFGLHAILSSVLLCSHDCCTMTVTFSVLHVVMVAYISQSALYDKLSPRSCTTSASFLCCLCFLSMWVKKPFFGMPSVSVSDLYKIPQSLPWALRYSEMTQRMTLSVHLRESCPQSCTHA